MELNDIYIPESIIDNIFSQCDYSDKIVFTKINQFTRKYKDSIKYESFNLINDNYSIFKLCFRKYKYTDEELLELGIRSMKGMKTIWGSTLSGYYDLRYIYEIIYAGLEPREIKGYCQKLNLYYLLNEIKKCRSFNHFETMKNINNNPSLYSLRRDFSNIMIDKKRIHWETIY